MKSAGNMLNGNLEMYKTSVKIDFLNDCKSINELNGDDCNGIDIDILIS